MDQSIIDKVRKNITNNEYVKEDTPHGYQLPQEYIDKMRLLGEKYKEVKWLPLDIPRIDFDDLEEFKDIWTKESIPILRTKPDVAEPWTKDTHPYGKLSSWYAPQFNGLTLWQNPAVPIETGTFAAKEYKGDSAQLKRIVEQVFDYFPIHTMLTVFIWQSTCAVQPHRDKSAYWKCPTDFRVMLHDENEDPTLFVADIEKGDVNYIDCPPDTNSFCWSNGTQVHGSDYYGKVKYLLCISGIQHSAKSDELFSRSIKKYKNQLNYDLQINL